MDFRKVFRSVARVFSIKDKKVTNQQNTRKSRKLTLSRYPSKTTSFTKYRVKDLIDFLTGSRSRRHSTSKQIPEIQASMMPDTNISSPESAPESETLVGSSNLSSTENHTVETFEQVPDHAGADNANSYPIDDGLTGLAFAQNVLPVLTAVVGGNQSIEDVEVADIAALPLKPPAPSIKSVLDGDLNNINDQSVEVSEAAGPAIFVNHDFVDSQGKPLRIYNPYEKTNTDVQFPNTDPTAETLIKGTDDAELAATIFHENMEDNILAVVATELSIDVPEIFQPAFAPLTTPNNLQMVVYEPEVTEPIGSDTLTPDSTQIPSAEVSPSVDAAIQSSKRSINSIGSSAIQDESITSNEEIVLISEENHVTFPDHIGGYHLNGPFATATTVPHKARSFCDRVFTAPQLEERALSEDENSEDVVRQRRNSAPGNLVSPDSHYPTGRRASLTPSDAENEAMLNDPNNYIVHDDADMYIEPQLNIYPSHFAQPAIPMVTTPIGVPAENTSLQILTLEIICSHVDSPTPSASASGPLSPNESDSVEQEVFTSELRERLSLEFAKQEIFLSELRNTFPIEEDSPDVVNEQVEEVIVPWKVSQPGETHAAEIVRMYRIPRYSQFRSVFPAPGFTLPWGPQNPIPTRIDDFRGNDPWLPTPWTNSDAYHQLNGIQRRWVQLEVRYQTRLFWLGMNFKAAVHLEENPQDRLYAFNNFCGWYGCQAEKCKHRRVDGRLYFFDLDSYYSTWKQLRDQQLLLDNEPSNDNAAHEPETDVNALEQTAHRNQEARVLQGREQEVREQAVREQEAREQEASQVEPDDNRYADLNSSLKFANSAKAAKREMPSLMDSEVAVAKANSVIIQEVLARNEAQQVELRPSQLPNAQFGLAMINGQAQPKQSRWAQVFGEQKKDDCAKVEVPQNLVPDTTETPAPVGNFGLVVVDFPVQPKKSRFAEFFPVDSVAEETYRNPAPQAHFGLKMIEISVQPKKSRFASVFEAQASTRQGVTPAPTLDREDSREILDSLRGGNSDLSTRDTSLEPPQKSNFNLEANTASGTDAQYEEDESDLYSASLLRGPSPAPTESSQSSSIPAPEGFMDGSLASRHQGNWQLYDDRGSLLDDHVENVGGFVIKDTMEGLGDDEAFVFGQVEFPIEVSHKEFRDTLDGEPWIFIGVEDSPNNMEFDEVPEGVELQEDFFKEGWPLDEREENNLTQAIREGLEEERFAIIEIVSDSEYYVNAPDSGWEAPEDSDATESDSDESDEDCSDTENDSDSDSDSDSDKDGGDTEPNCESRESDKNSDAAETKAQGSNEIDNDSMSKGQESGKVVENTESKYQFSRIPIQARPAVSGLNLAFQKSTGIEIGYHVNEHPGFTNDPDAFIDSEPRPLLQEDANMVHSSNIIRQIDHARDELINRWMNREDYYDPDGPTCRYVLKEGERDGERVCDDMPQVLVLRIQDAENKLWASGATFAKIALAKKLQAPEMTTTCELEFALPVQVNNQWKPDFVAKCVKNVDLTDASLFLGKHDLFTFDENKSTF
ncbi:hypothetical protein BPOR_0409g00090 [Botrytis porri]|uniref:Uncharacterized protein n=1 Tax=Botrytis porri TaxID=87229 RepID=A0A4Z1KS59_9HELO|nr:hypothetical protein BPOR_0409g00090 [Botrytis porri]